MLLAVVSKFLFLKAKTYTQDSKVRVTLAMGHLLRAFLLIKKGQCIHLIQHSSSSEVVFCWHFHAPQTPKTIEYVKKVINRQTNTFSLVHCLKNMSAYLNPKVKVFPFKVSDLQNLDFEIVVFYKSILWTLLTNGKQKTVQICYLCQLIIIVLFLHLGIPIECKKAASFKEHKKVNRTDSVQTIMPTVRIRVLWGPRVSQKKKRTIIVQEISSFVQYIVFVLVTQHVSHKIDRSGVMEEERKKKMFQVGSDFSQVMYMCPY